MKKILIFFIFFLIISCAEYRADQKQLEMDREKKALENQRIEDISTCKYYGFKEETEGFTNCLMNLDLARKQELLTRKMLECEAVRRDNNQSAATGFWAGVLKGARENLVCD